MSEAAEILAQEAGRESGATLTGGEARPAEAILTAAGTPRQEDSAELSGGENAEPEETREARDETVHPDDQTFQNDVTIAGTLRAKRIVHPYGARFKDEATLRRELPNPHAGMWATTGSGIPGTIWTCVEEGKWERLNPNNLTRDDIGDMLADQLAAIEGKLAELSRKLEGDIDLSAALLADKFLSKLHGDRTPYALGVGGLLAADAGISIGNFIAGLRGAGSDERGNMEAESLTLRSYLKVMELIVNRQRIFDSEIMLTEGDTVESVTPFGKNNEGQALYTLKMKEEWEGYRTALYEGDVLRGIYNNIDSWKVTEAELEAPEEEAPRPPEGGDDSPDSPDSSEEPGEEAVREKNGAEYYTVWLRVIAVRPERNEVDVAMYADEETPARRNFAPLPLLKVARWGNAGEREAQKQRQRVIYLSSAQGQIMIRDHVTKPIVDEGNIVSVIGRLPDFLAKHDDTFKPGDTGLYVDNLYVGRITTVDFQGLPDPWLQYRGEWDPAGRYYDGTVRKPDYESDTQVHDWEKSIVLDMGCQWLCNESLTRARPSYDSTQWALYLGDPRLHLEWNESDIAVDTDNPELELTTTATINHTDITGDPHLRWDWERESWHDGAQDTASDEQWNAAHANCGLSGLTLKKADFNYRSGRHPEKLWIRVTATLIDSATGMPVLLTNGEKNLDRIGFKI